MTYWKLLDRKHEGEILRIEPENGGNEYVYRGGKWLKTGLSPSYLLDYGDYYGMYREITKSEVLRIIAE
jgi:hypothetical protein